VGILIEGQKMPQGDRLAIVFIELFLELLDSLWASVLQFLIESSGSHALARSGSLQRTDPLGFLGQIAAAEVGIIELHQLRL
jgi:hypothetical protein